jgi:Spy/CpxP family protein refolding chaperone
MHPRAGVVQRLAHLLNLTPDQKQQAKAIFQGAHATAQPLTAQMRDARQAIASAVKANAPGAEIDRLSNNAGALASQLTAVRAKAFEKFYTILTPDQKDQMDSAMDRFLKG